MSHRLEFFFDCSSPWTYLAFEYVQRRLEGLLRERARPLEQDREALEQARLRAVPTDEGEQRRIDAGIVPVGGDVAGDHDLHLTAREGGFGADAGKRGMLDEVPEPRGNGMMLVIRGKLHVSVGSHHRDRARTHTPARPAEVSSRLECPENRSPRALFPIEHSHTAINVC